MLFFLMPINDSEERWQWLLSKLGNTEMNILYQEAYSILGNKEDAYVVLHKALLKAFSKCNHLRNESNLFYWIIKIVRNEAYTFHKRFSLHTIIAQAKLVLAKPLFCNSSEYLAVQQQENVRLRRAIDALGYPEKDILVLKIFEEKSFDEIAEKLNLNVNTVRSQYLRMLKKMKQVLEAKEHE